jgi:hypothetical protein
VGRLGPSRGGRMSGAPEGAGCPRSRAGRPRGACPRRRAPLRHRARRAPPAGRAGRRAGRLRQKRAAAPRRVTPPGTRPLAAAPPRTMRNSSVANRSSATLAGSTGRACGVGVGGAAGGAGRGPTGGRLASARARGGRRCAPRRGPPARLRRPPPAGRIECGQSGARGGRAGGRPPRAVVPEFGAARIAPPPPSGPICSVERPLSTRRDASRPPRTPGSLPGPRTRRPDPPPSSLRPDRSPGAHGALRTRSRRGGARLGVAGWRAIARGVGGKARGLGGDVT